MGGSGSEMGGSGALGDVRARGGNASSNALNYDGMSKDKDIEGANYQEKDKAYPMASSYPNGSNPVSSNLRILWTSRSLWNTTDLRQGQPVYHRFSKLGYRC